MPDAVVVRRHKEKPKGKGEWSRWGKGLGRSRGDYLQRLVVRNPGIVRLPQD